MYLFKYATGYCGYSLYFSMIMCFFNDLVCDEHLLLLLLNLLKLLIAILLLQAI